MKDKICQSCKSFLFVDKDLKIKSFGNQHQQVNQTVNILLTILITLAPIKFTAKICFKQVEESALKEPTTYTRCPNFCNSRTVGMQCPIPMGVQIWKTERQLKAHLDKMKLQLLLVILNLIAFLRVAQKGKINSQSGNVFQCTSWTKKGQRQINTTVSLG